MLRNFTLSLLVLAAFTGCASGGLGGLGGGNASPFGDISKLAVSDLEAALADATAHQDRAAMACYPVLLGIVKSLPAEVVPKAPAGLVSAFQQARDLSKAVQSGATSGQNALVQQVNLGCAALFNDTQGDILRLGILFRP